MIWIFLAVGTQLINAVVAILDKYIVSDEKLLPRPFVYAFYSCLLAGAWIVIFFVGLLPLGNGEFTVPSLQNIQGPTLEVVALSFLGAYTFFIALVSMFTGLQHADASDVVPVIGAVSAIASFALSYLFLDADLAPNFIIGIFLLALGTILASRLRFSWQTAFNTIHAGLFFALHYIALKGLFNVTTFDNGFFWSRIAFVFLALSLLLVPSYLQKIREQTKSTGRKAGMLVFFNKVLAGIGTILILKATELGDVSVVQALGGLQFVFILGFGIFFGARTPKTCGEEECQVWTVLLQKVLFVLIISLGFFALFVDFSVLW